MRCIRAFSMLIGRFYLNLEPWYMIHSIVSSRPQLEAYMEGTSTRLPVSKATLLDISGLKMLSRILSSLYCRAPTALIMREQRCQPGNVLPWIYLVALLGQQVNAYGLTAYDEKVEAILSLDFLTTLEEFEHKRRVGFYKANASPKQSTLD